MKKGLFIFILILLSLNTYSYDRDNIVDYSDYEQTDSEQQQTYQYGDDHPYSELKNEGRDPASRGPVQPVKNVEEEKSDKYDYKDIKMHKSYQRQYK